MQAGLDTYKYKKKLILIYQYFNFISTTKKKKKALLLSSFSPLSNGSVRKMRRVMVDRKMFTLRKSKCGKRVSAEEWRGSRVRLVELDVGSSTWVRDCLVSVSKAGRPLGFWRRRRLDATILFF